MWNICIWETGGRDLGNRTWEDGSKIRHRIITLGNKREELRNNTYSDIRESHPIHVFNTCLCVLYINTVCVHMCGTYYGH